ncbi:Crt-like protein [Scenedesmus sp. NREL 46B-D3]|nr:Crt-like protein [Scenedesmus sp. NREL 46B-D3]
MLHQGCFACDGLRRFRTRSSSLVLQCLHITPYTSRPHASRALRSAAAAAAAAAVQPLAARAVVERQQRLACKQQLPQKRRQVTADAAKDATGGLATWGLVAAVLSLGTLNRVLYRLALVPLRDYVFFLAQAQNIGYLVIYFSLMFIRYRQGKVSQAMLATPKPLFVLTGLCEAAAQLLMMTGAAHLPGALLPLLMQTVLLWNMLFSRMVFGTKPNAMQNLGVAAVLAGVAVASWPSGSSAAAAAAEVEPAYLLLCIVSFAFPALATIIKERIFKDAARRLGGGQQLDVLVVNSYCSAAQAGFLLLLLPVTCHLKGLSLPDLPAYLTAGTACLLGGSPACGADCTGAPLLPLAYIAVNIAFNVAAVYLVRSSGAVATALTMSCLVPITVLAFTLPLPLLPQAQLGAGFVLGALLLMLGLLTYNAQLWLPAALQLGRKWQAGLLAGG